MDGDGSLEYYFPKLFRLAVKKDSFVNDCFEVRSGCIVWGPLLGGVFVNWRGASYEEFLSIVTNRESKDSRI